jgi:hypothetical protein
VRGAAASADDGTSTMAAPAPAAVASTARRDRGFDENTP